MKKSTKNFKTTAYMQTWVVEPLDILVAKKFYNRKGDYIFIVDYTRNDKISSQQLYEILDSLEGRKRATSAFMTAFDNDVKQNKMVEIDLEVLRENKKFTLKNVEPLKSKEDEKQEKSEEDLLQSEQRRNTSVKHKCEECRFLVDGECSKNVVYVHMDMIGCREYEPKNE